MKNLIKSILFKIDYKPFKCVQFRCDSLLDPLPQHALSAANEHLRNLSLLGVHMRYSDGSLLGLLREKSFIDHDNDVDFDVLFSEPTVKLIIKYAKKNTWQRIREVRYFKKCQQLTYIDTNNIIFDFIFWEGDKRKLFNFSEYPNIRIMDAHFLLELENKVYDGREIAVPKKSLEWLIMRYGENWKTPKGQKGNWQEDCGDMHYAWWVDKK